MWCAHWFRTVGVQHCAVPVKATNHPSVIHWDPGPLIWWNWTGDPGQNTVGREKGDWIWIAMPRMWTGSAARFVCVFVCFVLRVTHVLPRAKYRSGKRPRVVSNDSALLSPPPPNKILIRLLMGTNDNARFLLKAAAGKRRMSAQFSI
jgi:hypothetical protein